MDAPEEVEIDALTRALDVHSLRILVAIERIGSISGAARELGYTQPAITQHVQRLEARLGAPLVARSARSARLTPIGRLLAQHTPHIDASLTAAATELARALGQRAGSVRLVAIPGLIGPVIAPVLGRMSLVMPGVEVAVLEACDRESAIEFVRDGRADVAVTSAIAGAAPRSRRGDGLRSTFLFAEEVVALTSVGVNAAASRIAPQELAGLAWVIGPDNILAATVAESIGRESGPADIKVSRMDAAIALVSNGFGAAFVVESAVAGVEVPPAVRLFGLSPALVLRTTATTLDESAAIPSVAAALRILASHRPASAEIDDTLAARRRRVGHRSRFPPHPMIAERPEAEPVDPTSPHHSPNHTPQNPNRNHDPNDPDQHPTDPDPMKESPMPLPSPAQLARAGAVAAVGAVLLSACSSPSANAAGLLHDTGKQIDSVTIALPGSLSNLYVGQEAGILNYYVASITQEGLVSVDAEGRIQPGLAKSWTHPDDITYVYELRSDAKFQDGTPVTADDVVFSLDEARDQKASPGLVYYLSDVKTIEKTGPSEVTIKLTAPDAAFAENMSSGGAAFITSKAFWEKHDGKVGTPDALLMGSGPYKVTEFAPDSHVTFERVDTWWGPKPKVKKLTVNFVPDESTRLLAAQSGDVDLAFNVPLAQAAQWEKLKTMRVDYVNDLSYVGLYFNTKIAPFDDPKVREAIAHAVDRKAYVSKLLRGHGEAATAIMTPEALGRVYSPTEARKLLAGVPQWNFDMKAAKAALAASTHPNGFEAEILTPNTGPQLGTAAQALSQNLAEIGITLKVREVPIEEWLASLDPSSGHGLNLMWYFSTLGDPAEVPSYLLGAGNPASYDNPKIVDLLAQAGAASDPKARIATLIKAETLQAKDAVNIPLWWGQSATAFSKNLGIKKNSPFAYISSWPVQLFRAGQ
jgi:molybdate transport repressor ModE-like protein